MSIFHVGYPVTNCLIDGIFERFTATFYGAHLGTEQLHAVDVRLLPGNVHATHVDDAFQPQQRAGGGGAHAMLPGSRLGNDARFAHTLGQQRLTQRIIDFVRAGVVQIFPLKVDLRPAQAGAESFGIGDGRRPSHVTLEQILKLSHKRLILQRLIIDADEFIQGGHEGFRHKLAAIRAKFAAFIGYGCSLNHKIFLVVLLQG